MRLVTMVTAVALTGCGMLPEREATVPVRSEVPIEVPCIKREELPERLPTTTDRVTRDSPDGQVITELAVMYQRQGAQNELLWALIEGCIDG